MTPHAARAAFRASLGMIAYTFAGYPALVAGLARLRPRPLRLENVEPPTVSLIVAAYNEEDVIEEKLRNTLDLDYPRDLLEVIVVADGSDDRTADLARGVAGVTVLHEPERRGKAAAVNRAVESARGEVIVLSDANNVYTRETMRELVAPFSDPSVGVVSGRKAIDDGTGRPLDRAEGLYWRYEAKLRSWETAIGSVVGAVGEATALRREAFRPAPPGTVNEDLMQAMHAVLDGWRVVYAPGAVSLERASATLADESVRRSRIVTGRSQAMLALLPALARRDPQFAWQALSHKALRPLVPGAMLVAAVSSVARARGHERAGRVWLALQGAAYAAALLGWLEERSGRSRHRPLYLAYYFVRMNFATVSGLTAFARGRYSADWTKVRRG